MRQQQALSCRQVKRLLFCIEEALGQWRKCVLLCRCLYVHVCLLRHVSLLNVYVNRCLYMSANSHPHVSNMGALVHMEKQGLKEQRTWILSFSGLTLARPQLANSRQQIRSWELPTALVTETWWRAGELGCFTARMGHDTTGMLPMYSQNK